MSATVAIPKHGAKLGEGFSKAEKLKAIEHPGRQTDPRKGYQSAVSWIADLIALRKCIILCSFCRAKFNPRRFGYRRVYVADYTGKTDGYTVNGACDACKGETANLSGGTAYTPEELYEQTHVDPTVARRKARTHLQARSSQSIWRAVQAEVKQKNQR